MNSFLSFFFQNKLYFVFFRETSFNFSSSPSSSSSSDYYYYHYYHYYYIYYRAGRVEGMEVYDVSAIVIDNLSTLLVTIEKDLNTSDIKSVRNYSQRIIKQSHFKDGTSGIFKCEENA